MRCINCGREGPHYAAATRQALVAITSISRPNPELDADSAGRDKK